LVLCSVHPTAAAEAAAAAAAAASKGKVGPPKELQRKGRESGRARRHRREVEGEERRGWRLPAWRTLSSSTSRGEARSVFFGKGSEGNRSVCVLACVFFGVFFSSASAVGKEVSAVVNNLFVFPLMLVADQCRSGPVMLFFVYLMNLGLLP